MKWEKSYKLLLVRALLVTGIRDPSDLRGPSTAHLHTVVVTRNNAISVPETLKVVETSDYVVDICSVSLAATAKVVEEWRGRLKGEATRDRFFCGLRKP